MLIRRNKKRDITIKISIFLPVCKWLPWNYIWSLSYNVNRRNTIVYQFIFSFLSKQIAKVGENWFTQFLLDYILKIDFYYWSIYLFLISSNLILQLYWQVFELTAYFVFWLILPVNHLIIFFVYWLVGGCDWLIDLLVNWLVYQLIIWLIYWLVGWLIMIVIDWLIYWLVHNEDFFG